MTVVVTSTDALAYWPEWYDLVIPHAPGVPRAMATQMIRLSCREFLRRTWVYKVLCDLIDVVEDTASYTVSVPSGTDLVIVLEAYYNDKQLTHTPQDELVRQYADWESEEGTPIRFTQLRPDQVRLFPIPDADLADGLKVFASVMPELTVPYVPAYIWEHYAEFIAYGALAKLHAMPKKPWSDGTAAAINQARFDHWCGKVKVEASRGHTRAQRRVRAQFM